MGNPGDDQTTSSGSAAPSTDCPARIATFSLPAGSGFSSGTAPSITARRRFSRLSMLTTSIDGRWQRSITNSSPTRLTTLIVDRCLFSQHACMPSFELGPLTIADREASHGAVRRG
jgi:hypothetical protein